MAGLRIGAAIASPDLVRLMRSAVINDLGTNSLAQEAGVSGLRSKHLWINDLKETCFRNQEIIKEAIDNTPGTFLPVYPSDGNMMAVDVSGTGLTSQEVSDHMLKKDIFVRAGNYTSKLFGDKYIRISFSIPTEQVEKFREEFPKAIKELQEMKGIEK